MFVVWFDDGCVLIFGYCGLCWGLIGSGCGMWIRYQFKVGGGMGSG